MLMLRVGKLTLNLAQVTLIRDLAAPAPQRGGLRIEFHDGQRIDIVNDAEAGALRAWLAENSQSVAPSG
jgi:hypothetical protein